MPLLDHLNAPIYPTHSWESFHARWASNIADALDSILPDRYFAEVQAHAGSRIEADVAEFEQPFVMEHTNGVPDGGGVAVQNWAPPAATVTIPVVFPDDIEVRVRDTRDGAVVVAVIELVSPGNKDREENREAFTAKCSAFLHHGLGLIVVDVVTNRHANLHNELMRRLGQGTDTAFVPEPSLYATAYHPKRHHEKNEIDVWLSALAVGDSLPLLPLALRGGLFVPLNLEATYRDTRQRCRL